MKLLKTLLFALTFAYGASLSAQASLLTVAITNSVTGLGDTNFVYVIPLNNNNPVLADGSIVTKGIATRAYPDTNGLLTVWRGTGFYAITNKSIALVYRFNDMSSNATAYIQSGWNTYGPAVVNISTGGGPATNIPDAGGVTTGSITNQAFSAAGDAAIKTNAQSVVNDATNALGSAARSSTNDFAPNALADFQWNGWVPITNFAMSDQLQGVAVGPTNYYVNGNLSLNKYSLSGTLISSNLAPLPSGIHVSQCEAGYFDAVQSLWIIPQEWVTNGNYSSSVVSLYDTSLTRVATYSISNSLPACGALVIDNDRGKMFAISPFDATNLYAFTIPTASVPPTFIGLVPFVPKLMVSASGSPASQGIIEIGGILYIQQNVGFNGNIVAVNPDTGASQWVTTYHDINSEYEGLAYDGNNLIQVHADVLTNSLSFFKPIPFVSTTSLGRSTINSPVVSQGINDTSGGKILDLTFSSIINATTFDQSQTRARFNPNYFDTQAFSFPDQIKTPWGYGIQTGPDGTICDYNKNDFYGLTNFTLSFSFNATTAGASPGSPFVSKYNSSFSGEFLVSSLNTNVLQFIVAKTNSSARIVLLATNATSFLDGNWHEVIATFEGGNYSASNQCLYLDGNLLNSTANDTPWVNTNYPCHFRVGGSDLTTITTACDYDEVKLWNRAFSATEVANYYRSQYLPQTVAGSNVVGAVASAISATTATSATYAPDSFISASVKQVSDTNAATLSAVVTNDDTRLRTIHFILTTNIFVLGTNGWPKFQQGESPPDDVNDGYLMIGDAAGQVLSTFDGSAWTNIPASSITGSATNGDVIVSTESDGGLLATNPVTGDYRHVSPTMDVNTTGSFNTSKLVSSGTNVTTNFTAYGTVNLPGVTTGTPASSKVLRLDSSANAVLSELTTNTPSEGDTVIRTGDNWKAQPPSGGGTKTNLVASWVSTGTLSASAASVIALGSSSYLSTGSGDGALMPLDPGSYKLEIALDAMNSGGMGSGTNITFWPIISTSGSLTNYPASSTITGPSSYKVAKWCDSAVYFTLVQRAMFGVGATNNAGISEPTTIIAVKLSQIQ